ncbi:MAG: SGNH/GDSL hydrolase family protein [Anaerolineae bacterium]|nr:SGNH/GDSL hydrolase family protein [Anaerolineae bacterium]
MKSFLNWWPEDELAYSWRFIVRVAKRVLYLFIIFNFLYYLFQPLEIGRPTLYNGAIPGRVRMEWSPGGLESFGVNELRLSRLLADHAISRSKAENEYRVLFIGSSEIWGYFNKPQDTMPIALDRLSLFTSDGRMVRSYNLSYVYPNAIKDMLILNYVLSHGTYNTDLIVWVVNPKIFMPNLDPHWLEMANPELTVSMARQYGLSSQALDQVAAELEVPWWRRHSFLSERDDIAYWLLNQFYGLAWSTTGADLQFPDVMPRDQATEGEDGWNNQQPGAFEALVTMAGDHDMPLVLVSSPMAWEAPEYNRWLAERADSLGVPLLDCSELLSSDYFTDTHLHLTTEGHNLFAEQVALWLRPWLSISNAETNMVAICPSHD